ncbi:MAG: heparinase II/III family protein [Candidatus Puniceispirillaceae bacterium]
MSSVLEQQIEKPKLARWRLTRFERLMRHSALFRWQLRGPLPVWPTSKLVDPWQGNAMRGSQLVQGGIKQLLTAEAYHDFSWLRDVRDYGGAAGRTLARDHINLWCQRYNRWDEALYRPDRLGVRLTNLFFTLRWFAESASDDFQQSLLQSLSFQAKALALDWQRLDYVDQQIPALKGLFISQVMLRNDEKDLEALLDVTLAKAKSLLHPDWGHKSRSPEAHLALLRHLIELKLANNLISIQPANQLDEMITSMGNLTKLWRHGNGEFAHFQGGGESTSEQIDTVLKKCGPKGKITPQAPHTGYLRLSAARNTLIMDAGSPSPRAKHACASTLAFEFSVANTRFIVGTGQHSADDRLASALAKTSAHSTLTLDGLDSSQLPLQQPGTTTISNQRIASIFDVEAGPADGGMLVVGSHDGYRQSHGILHHRQIYLTNDGHNLRGSDRLEYTGDPGEIPGFAIVRFHLHPRVSAAILQDMRILLKLPGHKAGWIFKSSGGTAQLEQSVYFDGARRSSCQQIVLSVPVSQIRTIGEVEARWAFIRSKAG